MYIKQKGILTEVKIPFFYLIYLFQFFEPKPVVVGLIAGWYHNDSKVFSLIISVFTGG